MTLPTRSNSERITAEFFNSIKTEIENIQGIYNITSKTGNYTLTASENIVFVDATSGPVTITLPAISDNDGRKYYIKKTDNSANAVTVDANGSETIDGSLTYSLSNQYDWVGITSNGSEWSIITKKSDITAASATTFTNKTIDVDNNTLSNIEVDNLKSGVLDTDISSVAGTHTTLASALAIKNYVDNSVIDLDTTNFATGIIDTDLSTVSASDDTLASAKAIKAYVDTGSVTASSTTTFTNKTIDVDNNTLSNIEVDNLKSGVLDTDISSVAGTHTTLASALAIKNYVDSVTGGLSTIYSAAYYDGSGQTLTDGSTVTWDTSLFTNNISIGGGDQYYTTPSFATIGIVYAKIITQSVVAAANQYFAISLTINGVTVAFGNLDSSDADAVDRRFTSQLLYVGNFSSNDLIRVAVSENIGNTITMETSANFSHFGIYLIA